ncbi:MAG: 1-deoxy-D-xylulose-5-phosphate synthase [Actinomycetota bacterium]
MDRARREPALLMDSILQRVDSPADLKRLYPWELDQLAVEIRRLIIDTTCATGGHLASSLGVVELTMAVHRALDAPRDRIIWDVGHQSYAHKIITGRRDRFSTLRQKDGLSGFPRRSESDYDVVDSGHSGSSISYGLGLCLARDLLGADYGVAVVIGDGSMSSGVAFEALNQVGHHLDSNLIIILNDNEMSISQNVGGFAAYLSRIRLKPGYTHFKEDLEEFLSTMPGLGAGLVRVASQLKEAVTHALVPGGLFESLGLKYVGPIDGHDVALVEETVREARRIKGPVLIHARTLKGKGYGHSERRPERFHGVASFDEETGTPLKTADGNTFTERFGKAMVGLAAERPRLVAITAAMRLGTGLTEFSDRYPERFFDVGIAEQLGVNLGAALALGGLEPVVAIYSTFLQRAFDQLSQEVCLQGLPVVFAIDRAGVVGEDGSTHHGYFDISLLRSLPGMTVMAPCAAVEVESMLHYALEQDGPTAIRYPRGTAPQLEGAGLTPIRRGEGEVIREGGQVVILALGSMVKTALEAADILEGRGISTGVVSARFAKPLDAGFLEAACTGVGLVVTLEDGVLSGGFGSGVLEAMQELPTEGRGFLLKGLPDRYLQHASIPELMEESGLTAERVAEEAAARLEHA